MGVYGEDELLPLSGLQHVVFCERQYALIHLEGIWSENLFTARGDSFHTRAHDGTREVRNQCVSVFGVHLRSLALGVSGKADAVEFTYSDRTLSHLECATPVEYKVGSPKRGMWDRVQVAAQAMCLEEMLHVSVKTAYLYYGKTRRRVSVDLDGGIRERVRTAAERTHELVRSGVTPGPVYEPRKCDRCSLFDMCKPKGIGARSASGYLRSAVLGSLRD